MTDAVSARLRRLVLTRATGLCEYCLIHQEDAHFSFHVDHIIGRKQRGPTVGSNLALACLRCNVAKGTDVGAFIGRPRRLIRLYHLRQDHWADHFRIASTRIVRSPMLERPPCSCLTSTEATAFCYATLWSKPGVTPPSKLSRTYARK